MSETDTDGTARREELDEAFGQLTDSDSDSESASGSGDTDGGKPDPSELSSIDTSQHIHQRDENGDLIPIPDAVEVEGEWHKVEHLPLTKGFLARVQNKFGGREDIDFDEIDGLLSDFYADPDISEDEWEDMAAPLYMSLMTNMVNKVKGGMDDATTQEIRQAVESRREEGN